MTERTDPEYSRTMQWLWSEAGKPVQMADSRLGGYEPYYQDRHLPAQAPHWNSTLLPHLGVFFRSAFNTPSESFLIALTHVNIERCVDIWSPDVGNITQWFGRGKPLSTIFNQDTGYAVRHQIMAAGVQLARNWGQPGDSKSPFGHYMDVKPEAVALQPRADYVRTTFVVTKADDRDWWPNPDPPALPKVTPAKSTNLTWTRQLVFLKDADPAGAAYILLRDTTRGGEPTTWRFWTLSDKMGTPDQVKDAAAFLADKPGAAFALARELPMSDRYTALGALEMDVEYFIASPSNTPRHTFRYGGPDNQRVPEWQDALHLQLPGDGAYYVAIYPRPRGEAAPTFTALADGKLMKIATPFGTDYALLASEETTVNAEGVSLTGTAAAVQQRGKVTTLTLAAGGKLALKECALAAPFAATLSSTSDQITLTLPPDNPGGGVTLTLPAGFKMQKANGATVKITDTGVMVTVPKGAVEVIFTRQ